LKGLCSLYEWAVECDIDSALFVGVLGIGHSISSIFVLSFSKKYWCSDSSVINLPVGEPGRTPLCVGLPSAWDSMDSDRIFSPISWEDSTGDSNKYKLKNKALVLEMRILLGNMKGDSCTGDFEVKVNFWVICRRVLWKRVSLFVGTPSGNLGGESIYWKH